MGEDGLDEDGLSDGLEEEGEQRPAPRDARHSMAAPARQGKPPAEALPRSYAMRPLGGLIARVTRASFRRRSPAAAQLMMDWAEILGPGLAPLTFPQKLSAGTLTIGAKGPVAMELQHLAPQLIERLNTHLGAARDKPLVQRLRFVPMPLGVVAAPAAPRSRVRPEPPLPVPDLAAGPLNEALARLGQAVSARHKASPG